MNGDTKEWLDGLSVEEWMRVYDVAWTAALRSQAAERDDRVTGSMLADAVCDEVMGDGPRP